MDLELRMAVDALLRAAAGSMVLQTLILDKSKFKSRAKAVAWLRRHGYKTAIDETDSSYRARQKDPSRFKKGSFRTVQFKPGVQAVMGKLK